MIPVIPPAQVEVDGERRYISVNDSACDLLGYTRAELLNMRIEDVSFPTGAHVVPMFQQFARDGKMHGIFALKRKSGEVLRIQFEAEQTDGCSRAKWTHYEVWKDAEQSRLLE